MTSESLVGVEVEFVSHCLSYVEAPLEYCQLKIFGFGELLGLHQLPLEQCWRFGIVFHGWLDHHTLKVLGELGEIAS